MIIRYDRGIRWLSVHPHLTHEKLIKFGGVRFFCYLPMLIERTLIVINIQYDGRTGSIAPLMEEAPKTPGFIYCSMSLLYYLSQRLAGR